MKFSSGLIAIALLAAVATASAGEHKKCPAKTQDCLDKMSSKMKTSGWVGLELDWDQAKSSQVVTRVVPGSPAESAGIQIGDVLYALNGVRISPDNDEAIAKARKSWKPGESVRYTIKRNGTDREVNLTLAPMPADVLARLIGEHMLEHVSNDFAAVQVK